MQLSGRQESILCALVRDYTKTAQPVGSEHLTSKHKLPWSPATVRAEMAVLELDGYITHPHTSAGRVPTDKGFRYYVNLLDGAAEKAPSREERAMERVLEQGVDFNDAMRRAIWALAEMTHAFALGITPNARYSKGLYNLLSAPEYQSGEQSMELARLVDEVDTLFDESPSAGFAILIGQEMPVGKTANVAMILSRFKSPLSDNTPIAIIGPMRLPYERVIPLVRKTSEVLEELYGDE